MKLALGLVKLAGEVGAKLVKLAGEVGEVGSRFSEVGVKLVKLG